MARRLFVISYRWACVVLVVAAIVTQLAHTLRGAPAGNAINFLSFFTIESNIIAAAVFLIGAIPGRIPAGRWYDLARGAATTYMAMTGVVYVTLLSDRPAGVDTTIPWVNEVLHYLLPLVVFLDWLIVPPRVVVRVWHALVWALYPLAFAGYTLVRGAAVHWYPYPFLDAGQHGYGRILVNCGGIAVGAAIFISAIVWLGNAMQAGGEPTGTQTA